MRPMFLAAACAALTLTVAPAARAWDVTWLGHAGFLVESQDGTRLLIDPWTQNPKFPKDFTWPERIDGILVSHGHFDHAGSATELSARFKAPIVGSFELTSVLAPKTGPEGLGGNVGGTITVKGVKVSMIPAVHSSSASQEGQPPIYTGAPVGFVLSAPGEKTLLHAGDTAMTQEYEAVREIYKPEVALLPIGGHFTMDPLQAAMAARLLGVKQVVPMHFGTFPVLAGTPAQLKQHLQGSPVQMRELTPGTKTRL